MDMKGVVFIVSATVIYTFSNESMYTCPVINGTSCCPGHRWDLPQNKCITYSASCEKGYNGTNCSTECPYPTYGQNCQSNCNCIDKHCDHKNGCNRTKGERDIPSSLGLIYTSLTSEYVTSKVSIPKPFSACEKGYNGTNCSMKCPYPTYGQNCQSNCNCIDKDCDHGNGCNRTKGESDIPSSFGLIYTSLTSEYVTSKVSILKLKHCGIIIVRGGPVFVAFLGNPCQENFSYPRTLTPTNKNDSTVIDYFPSVSVHGSITTTFITKKQEIKCKSYLMFATIGLTVVALIVVFLYLYTWILEKRLLVSRVI